MLSIEELEKENEMIAKQYNSLLKQYNSLMAYTKELESIVSKYTAPADECLLEECECYGL